MPNYAYTHSYSYRLIKNSNFSKCSKRRKKHGNMNALRRQNYHLFVAVRTEAHVGVDPCVRMQRAVVRIYFVRMNLIIAHALDDCVGLLCRWSVRATSVVCVCVSRLSVLFAPNATDYNINNVSCSWCCACSRGILLSLSLFSYIYIYLLVSLFSMCARQNDKIHIYTLQAIWMGRLCLC